MFSNGDNGACIKKRRSISRLCASAIDYCPNVSNYFIMPSNDVLCTTSVHLQSMCLQHHNNWNYQTLKIPFTTQQLALDSASERTAMMSLWHRFLGTFRSITHSLFVPGYELCSVQYQRYFTTYCNKVNSHTLQQQQKCVTHKRESTFGQLSLLIAETTLNIMDALFSLVQFFKNLKSKHSMSSSHIQSKNCQDALPSSSDDTVTTYLEFLTQPTFCYFVIDSNPTKLCNENVKSCRMNQEPMHCYDIPILQTCVQRQPIIRAIKTWSNSFATQRHVNKHDDDQNANRNCSLVNRFLENENWLSNTRLKGCSDVFSPRSFPEPARQRHISECSDESFVCFIENEDCECLLNSDDDNSEYEIDDVAHDDNDSDNSSNQIFDYYDSDLDTIYSDSPEDGIANNLNTRALLETDKSMHTISKKVRFDPNPHIHTMYAWDFAYRSARKSVWENYARDRCRFNQRIQRSAVYLDPILCPEHRRKIFESRFVELTRS